VLNALRSVAYTLVTISVQAKVSLMYKILTLLDMAEVLERYQAFVTARS